MSDEEKLNKSLGYIPDIKYTEDYGTDYIYQEPEKEYEENNEPLLEDDFVNHIQDTMDEIANMIPGLTEPLNTIVYQIFKPIYKDWKENISNNKYPVYIPDPDKIIIQPSKDKDIIDPIPPGTIPPSVYMPPNEVQEPGVQPTVIPILPDDDIFEPDPNIEIVYPEIKIEDIIPLEFIKNIMDLYNYYTERLKDILSLYYLNLFQAVFATTSDEEALFLVENISELLAKVEDESLKHLMDSSLRSEVLGNLKLSFCETAFSVENTLYHLKNFHTVKELRLRYYTIKKDTTEDNDSTVSNKTLEGLRMTYDRKYDDAYIGLYKYLNSSLVVLEDTLQTIIIVIKSKHTLIKKGGFNK